jgi:hypothetical protein
MYDDSLVDDYARQIFEGSSSPYHVVSGSGWAWFLDPDVGEMVRIPRGIEVVPMPGEVDEYNRILVRSATRFLMIPAVEVMELGWN